jgi:tetratricopeptide (TPR) repeat protein
MPTKRRSQPAVRTTKKMAATPQTKRSAATKPANAGATAKSGKNAKPSKPVKTKPARPVTPARPARLAKPRLPAKPTASKKASARATRRPPARPLSSKAAAGRAGSRQGSGPAVPPLGPSSHDHAVETFERGFQALQQRQFGKAAEFLSAVINNFTDEKDLQERARVYLAICERQAARETKPRSFDDRLHAATVIVNRGAFDEALGQLRKLESDDAGNDYVQYLLSVVHVAIGNAEQALAHLRKAIELAPENRFRAAQDPDLEPLRQNAAFAELAGDLPRRRRAAAKKR